MRPLVGLKELPTSELRSDPILKSLRSGEDGTASEAGDAPLVGEGVSLLGQVAEPRRLFLSGEACRGLLLLLLATVIPLEEPRRGEDGASKTMALCKAAKLAISPVLILFFLPLGDRVGEEGGLYISAL